MNWMCSSLDGYRLVSNSDAHSPPMLGREATTLSCDLDYFAIAEAFRTGDGLAGTIEFFPEEGKYHLDGHRKCGVRLDPARQQRPRRDLPGVRQAAHHRRRCTGSPSWPTGPPGYRPPGAPGFTNLVQLRQIVGEIVGTGPASKKVAAEVSRLVGVLGPELGILCDVPLAEIQRAGGSAAGRGAGPAAPGRRDPRGRATTASTARCGCSRRASSTPGPRCSTCRARVAAREPPVPGSSSPSRSAGRPAPGPLRAHRRAPARARAAGPAAGAPGRAGLSGLRAGPRRGGRDRRGGRAAWALAGLLEQLDAEQRAAALAASPLMIVAGPGTGKTRTLTHRIAAQVAAAGPGRPAAWRSPSPGGPPRRCAPGWRRWPGWPPPRRLPHPAPQPAAAAPSAWLTSP